MKNTFGTSVTLTLFGESRGAGIGAVLDGMAPGIPVDPAFLAHQMRRRRSVPAISTGREESDAVELQSGVYEGRTTGTPIAIWIRNQTTSGADDAAISGSFRPGHADYTAFCKYHGFADPRGGGHGSGRLTAGIVAAGAIALTALRAKKIRIGTHISECAGVRDRAFCDMRADFDSLEASDFSVLDPSAARTMTEAILRAKTDGDSVGGILETAVTGVPAGVGEPFFDTLEGVLAHALFGIPAVKGVEFGDGFALASCRGSSANDAFCLQNGSVTTKTNHCGGILGGISVGTPLLFRTAVKPTPSIYQPQETVDRACAKETSLRLSGHYDPAIVHRACVVADSMTALVLCDLLAQRFGTDFLGDDRQ